MLRTVVAAIAVAALAAATTVDEDPRRHLVAHHSLSTPILSNYWESGIGYWSFGLDAVATDHYVRLTPPRVSAAAGVKDITTAAAPHNAGGYLWNQVPSDLTSWRLQYRLTISETLHFSLFRSECETCGVAFWYMEEPVRHREFGFFGVPSSFRGLGVVIRPDGHLYVVHNDGDRDFTTNLAAQALGTCSVAVGTTSLDIAVDYEREGPDGGRLTVWTAPFGAAQHTTCMTANVDLPHRYYYGFTAHSAKQHPLAYDLGVVQASSLFEEKDPAKLEAGAKEFDARMERQQQEFWKERGDNDPSQ